MLLSNKHWEALVLVSLTVLLCLPIFIFRGYLTADGYSHVYNSYILRDYLFNREYFDSFWNAWYDVELKYGTNVLYDLLLLLLTWLFDPLTANGIGYIVVVFLCVVGIFKYSKSFCGNGYIGLMASVWFLGYIANMGFSNYMLSIGLSLFAASYLVECLKSMKAFPNLLWYGVFLLLAALSNPLPVFIVGPVVAFHLLSSGKIKAQVGKIFLVSIPSIAICLHFLSRYTPSAKELYNFREMVDFFYGGSYLTVYSNYEFMLSKLYLLICLIVLVFIPLAQLIFKPGKEGFKALIPIYFIAVSFLIPGNFAEQGLMHVRSSFFFFLGCSLFGAMFVNQIRAGLVIILAMIIIASFQIVRWPHYRENNNILLDTIRISEYVKENSVILQVIYDRNGNFSNDQIESHCCIWQFTHLGSLVASWSKSIAFDNYEADTPWFMVTWQEGVNPYKRLKGGFELAPPQLNLSNPLLDSVDYVMTVFKSTEDSSPFSTWLQENFTRQEVEGADGELALYRRNS